MINANSSYFRFKLMHNSVIPSSMFDDVSATVKMETMIGLHDHGVDDLYEAMKKAIELLRSEK